MASRARAYTGTLERTATFVAVAAIRESLFGELALLGGDARTASVMTEEDSRLLVISKEETAAPLVT